MNEQETQVCKKCGKILPLSEFHKNISMASRHSGKCKTCVKLYEKEWRERLHADPAKMEQRNRKKRENFRTRRWKLYIPTPEDKQKNMKNYQERYPEKREANRVCGHLPKQKGFHNHHWSYNKEHLKDVMCLSTRHHFVIHRHMTYDQERMMYRRMDGSLIDSREAAIAYYATLKDE